MVGVALPLTVLALAAAAPAERTLDVARTADPFDVAAPIADLRAGDHMVTLRVRSAPRRPVSGSLVVVCARMDGRARIAKKRFRRRRAPLVVSVRKPRFAHSRCAASGDARLGDDMVAQGFRWRLVARLSAR
jgi:hypothetical protein